jgi:hypothetical protein
VGPISAKPCCDEFRCHLDTPEGIVSSDAEANAGNPINAIERKKS